VRAALPLLAIGLLGCGKHAPLEWVAPASGAMPDDCQPAGPDLTQRFATGQPLSAERAAALFPELGLQVGWVARVELRSLDVLQCGGSVVVVDPELRFLTRRGELLDVALITDVMVHPRMIFALRRDVPPPPSPNGAWLASDRTTLRRVGPALVGRVEQP